MATPRKRQNVTELTSAQVDLLAKAFQGIMAKDHTDPQSYFALANWHGIGVGVCNHHNPLFLIWHRAYVQHFENALRSVPGCDSVTLPFWDATAENPAFPAWMNQAPFASYDVASAFKGEWNTKIFPNGLTAAQNYQAVDSSQHWLANSVPTYRNDPATILSNIRSDRNIIYLGAQAAVQTKVFGGFDGVSFYPFPAGRPKNAIETPHDYIHGDTGGWMGDPTYAAFDPIFWFHHCNIERLFHIWQTNNNYKTAEALIANIGVDRFGKPLDASLLKLDTQYQTRSSAVFPSVPNFIAPDSFTGKPRDYIWDAQTNVTTYSPGSAQNPPRARSTPRGHSDVDAAPVISSQSTVIVKNINRAIIPGPFKVQLTIGQSEPIEQFVFQRGTGCEKCEEDPDWTVEFEVSNDLIKAGAKVDIRLFGTNIFTREKFEIHNYGKPTINIRSLLF